MASSGHSLATENARLLKRVAELERTGPGRVPGPEAEVPDIDQEDDDPGWEPVKQLDQGIAAIRGGAWPGNGSGAEQSGGPGRPGQGC